VYRQLNKFYHTDHLASNFANKFMHSGTTAIDIGCTIYMYYDSIAVVYIAPVIAHQVYP